MTKTVTIRTSLLRSFITLILGVSLTILAVMTFGAKRTVEELSGILIDQSSRHAEDELANFFGVVDGMLGMSKAWWDAGMIEYRGRSDLAKLNALFRPLLEETPQITSMMLANDEGFEYLLFRDLRGGDEYEWYTRIVRADQGPDAGFEARFTSDMALHSEGPLPAEARDYDPRRRPFYADAEPGEIHWTAPYYFFVTRDAGVTASLKWVDEAGAERLVAFDLLLMDLSRFTSGLRPTPDGQVFVVHQDGSILGLPADGRWADPPAVREALRHPGDAQADQAARLSTANDLGLQAVGAAVATWRGLDRDASGHFDFTAAGEPWWGGFRPVPIGDQMLWIGVAVPERDFLAQADAQRNVVLVVSGIALLVAIAMTGVLARRYSRPLEELAAQSGRIRDLRLDDAPRIESSLHEVSELARANDQMVAALQSFSRYVPMDLVRQLVGRGEVARIGGRDAELTILFTDVAGFTSVSERMSPQRLTDHMAEYFEVILEELDRQSATVDKFVGDAVVAFWGAPEPDPDQAKHAVRAVLRCRDRLHEMNRDWESRGLPPLPTRFGLNSGDAVVGNVGAANRLNYTVLGDTVNMASRLEALNGRYGTNVLVTDRVVEAAGPEFVWRLIDRVAVKGRTQAVAIYEPLGEAGAVSPAEVERARAYEEALAAYAEGRFADAEAGLARLLENGPDRPSERLLDLCRRFAEEPPEEPWNGVTTYDVK